MSPRYSASGLFDDDATIPLDEDALVRPNLRELLAPGGPTEHWMGRRESEMAEIAGG
jgi:hypothetical protein